MLQLSEAGAVHRSPCIYLMTEENPRTHQLGDSSDDGFTTSYRLNGVPYLQIMSVISHSTSGREKEGIKDIFQCLNRRSL